MVTMTGGEALVAALTAHGVDVVFGIPGTHNLEIYKHLAEHGVRHVGTRHEQGAGYAADGYARASGRPGVAVVTTGPALLNAAAAVGQAYSDSVPVLVVSPGLPLRHPATGNGLLHEMKSQGTALAAVAATSLRPTSVSEIPTAVAQAFTIMTAGRPRPVHLEVPLDVLAETGHVIVTPPVPTAPALPPEVLLEQAVVRLAAAVRPVILAGGGSRAAAPELAAVAEALGAPVVTTTNGKGVLPEDHPLALGAGVHLPTVRDLVEGADVVLAVGTELAPADLWYGSLPVLGKLVRIDVDPIAIVTNAVPEVPLVGDARAVLGALLTGLTGPAAAQLRGEPCDMTDLLARKTRDAQAEGAEWLDVIEALGSVLPRETVVAADNAMVCYFGAMTNLRTYTPGSFLFPTGFGTLGYGLPAGIGVKVAQPDRPVVALLGDGGVMFTVQELATAAELGLALPIVVVDNSGYGEIRNEMADRGDPVHAVTFRAPDFAALGRAMGCAGVTVTDLAELAPAVAAALMSERPTVIHVRMPEKGSA
jgi:thiamine pyrophosphate-dependent acetolactate synthase large subunit-like protein